MFSNLATGMCFSPLFFLKKKETVKTPDGREFPGTAITKYGAQMAVYSNMVYYQIMHLYNGENVTIISVVFQ